MAEGPTVFNNRYELHRRLARGGMSDVYLARDLLLDRPVAVKVLFPEFAKDTNFVERFRREAKAAANLNHPNVVAIYDWGEQDETYFIVMEYVEGRSLAEIVRSDAPLDGRRAAEIGIEIAAALSFAHRNGVVHRDIKPGNVLVSPMGQVKVADFGIAQAMTTTTQLTQAGSVMGTATYFSPEQAQGKQVDPRSDLYSLGCVLYELLVGTPPFTGDTPVAIAYKHVQEQPVPPSSHGVTVPVGLETITMRLLAKDPAGRYASADDLRADLQRYLEGHKVSAAPIVAGGVAGAAAAASVAGATRAVAATPPPRPPVAPDPYYGGGGDYAEPRSRGGVFLAVLVVLLLALGVGLFVVANNLSSEDTGEVVVPQLVGLSGEEATAALEELGLEANPISEPNTDVPPGQVYDQDPPPGTRLEEGETVTFTVSTGERQEEVPDVVGLTQETAESLLANKGFLPDPIEEFSDTVEEGRIISQDPPPQSMANEGSVVKIVISKGPAPATVPDLRGETVDEARRLLATAELVLGDSTEQPSTTVPVGQIISSSPSAGSKVDKGSAVDVVVSSGPPPSTTSSSSTTSTTSSSSTSSSSSSTSSTTTTAAP